ncbi:hypothetical protein ACO2Q8_22890 [Larkinella sp. VNQ87]|uniref:hypothetical protein n=1 Tax=Larkinella sp. VNQ87 TaxID=3400921 RepID=UPI003C050701
MNRNDENEQWEERFRQLRNLEPAQPRPFFYGRLEARLEHSEAAAVLPWWLQKPVYALGTLGVLVVLNIAVAVWQNAPATPEPAPDTYEAFVQDYQLNHQTTLVDE